MRLMLVTTLLMFAVIASAQAEDLPMTHPQLSHPVSKEFMIARAEYRKRQIADIKKVRSQLWSEEQARRKAEIDAGMALIRKHGYIKRFSTGTKPRALHQI